MNTEFGSEIENGGGRIIIFFFNDTATTEIYTLSLHDALPISIAPSAACARAARSARSLRRRTREEAQRPRSEEHTSELQSQFHLVCRLLLEKKKKITSYTPYQKKKNKKQKKK